MTSPWGRIADDGTAYVRDEGGERAIGSWHAGSPDEGLAFYTRKYDDLAAEVKLLEERIAQPGSDAKAIGASATKLADSLPTAAVIGDLPALATRLAGVQDKVEQRRAEQAKQREAAAAAAAKRKEALAEEAERLAESTSWRAGAERFRAIVEEWKAIRGVDRATDSALWQRFSAARREFDRRRRGAAAQAEADRTQATERKEALIKQAEKLAGSTEWGDTARKFRELMTEWKAAGRAGRENDDALWQRFKGAQDAFFAARSAAFAERDEKLGQNLEAKQALLREAESVDASNPDTARKQLRRLQERWEAAGRVPRDAMAELERRFGEVEDRLREAANTGRTLQRTESPLVIRLRESVGKLEGRLARAREVGDARLVEETETSLATQRQWLEQAEATGR